MSSLKLFGVLCFLILNLSCELTSSSKPETLVDQLIESYLSEEERLWQLVDSRADNAMAQIYQVHEQYLSDIISSSKSGIFHKEFDVPQRSTLSSLLNDVSATTIEIYQNLRRRKYNADDVQNFQSATSLLLERASELFQITNDSYFWKTLLLVRIDS